MAAQLQRPQWCPARAHAAGHSGPRPFGSARPAIARPRQQRVSVCRAVEEDEVDPYTGEVISRTSAIAKLAGFRVQAGGLEWAYRQSQVDKPDPARTKVLLLHGLGSSSYSYRQTLQLLGEAGYEAWAPDWPGHGGSEKPSPGVFGYSQAAYTQALQAFLQALGLDSQPIALVVQGFVLSQYALAWAAANDQAVSRVFILNTPLALNSKLRPELAAYKNPIVFLRPGNKPFDGAAFAMGGSPYAMAQSDAETYAQPYADPAASAAVAATMDALDWSKLLDEVDSGFRRWRKPSLLLFGNGDPFCDVKNAQAWLDSKRTNMRLVTATAKIGHMPQEDYPQALQGTLEAFLAGETDEWQGNIVSGKMTKKGLV